jgi:hypothetical protein
MLPQGHHAVLTTKPKRAQIAFEARILERFASLLSFGLLASPRGRRPNRATKYRTEVWCETPGVARVQHLREHSRNTPHSPLSRAFLSLLNLYALVVSLSNSSFTNAQTPS